MKKYMLLLVACLLVVVAGCGNESAPKEIVKPGDAVTFEIVDYLDEIAPIYMNQVPFIAYAETEGQFEVLKRRFKTNDIEMDMDKSFALFVVSQSSSCGIVPDGVYIDEGKLIVQLIEPNNDACEKDPLNHTFIIEVAKDDYKQVQLYNGNTIKSSMNVE